MGTIFLKVIAILWIILGVVWLFRPESFRSYVRKKIFKKYRRLALILLLITGGYLLSFFRFSFVAAKLIALLGLIVIIKALFLLNRKFSESLSRYIEKIPIFYIRVASLLLIGIGISIFLTF